MARKSIPRSPEEITRTRRHSPVRQRLIFCKEYIRTGNATGAWSLAFPDSIAEYNSRRASASKYLSMPATQQMIARLREKAFSRITVSIEELIFENAAIVRFDPARVYVDGDVKKGLKPWDEIEPEDRRCISEIKIDERYDPDGQIVRTTTVKRQDRGTALDRLAKIAGAYERDNAQKSAAAQAALAQKDSLQIAQRVAFLLQRGIRDAKVQGNRAPITIEHKTT